MIVVTSRLRLIEGRVKESFLALTVMSLLGLCRPAVVVGECPGDCDGDEHVRVDELVRGVNIALGESALEECGAIDVNADGQAAVDEILTAVDAAMRNCRGVRRRVLVYDAEVYYGLEAIGTPCRDRALVEKEAGGKGRISLDIYCGFVPAIYVDGSVGQDGTVELSGIIAYGDAPDQATGFASMEQDESGESIAGAVSSQGGRKYAFVLDRPRQARPDRFSGGYCYDWVNSPGGSGVPSAGTLVLTIEPSGFGRHFGGIDRDAAGRELGDFDSGACSVTPEGFMYCSGDYRFAPGMPAPDRFESVLTWWAGTLTAQGGHGRFGSGGALPPILPGGEWTARRTDADIHREYDAEGIAK